MAKMQDIAIEMLAQLEDLAKTAHQKPTSVLTDKVGERVLNAWCAIGRRRSAHSTIGLCRIDEKKVWLTCGATAETYFPAAASRMPAVFFFFARVWMPCRYCSRTSWPLFTTAGLSVTGPQLGRAFMLSSAGAPWLGSSKKWKDPINVARRSWEHHSVPSTSSWWALDPYVDKANKPELFCVISVSKRADSAASCNRVPVAGVTSDRPMHVRPGQVELRCVGSRSRHERLVSRTQPGTMGLTPYKLPHGRQPRSPWIQSTCSGARICWCQPGHPRWRHDDSNIFVAGGAAACETHDSWSSTFCPSFIVIVRLFCSNFTAIENQAFRGRVTQISCATDLARYACLTFRTKSERNSFAKTLRHGEYVAEESDGWNTRGPLVGGKMYPEAARIRDTSQTLW